MAPDAEEEEPCAIVVMGVSGAGKSTIAAMLAVRLGWAYEDADWFHRPSNVEKMHSGNALTDEDRWPWLQGIAACIDATREAGGHGVIACSALKRAYRDILVAGRRDVRIVYLKGERELIARRITMRHGHFMPASLLDNQFAALQEPGEKERPIIVSIDARPPRDRRSHNCEAWDRDPREQRSAQRALAPRCRQPATLAGSAAAWPKRPLTRFATGFRSTAREHCSGQNYYQREQQNARRQPLAQMPVDSFHGGAQLADRQCSTEFP